MKRSELREIIREALQGYSKYTGKTQGGTSADFMKILTAIAKGEPSQVERGNAVLDKANLDNVAKILRGEKPVYENTGDTLSKEELVKHLSELDPKSIFKISGVEGSGNRSTYSNSVENWQAKAADLVDAEYEMQAPDSFKTDGRVFKSDTSQPPSEKAVRGMMRGQK